MAPTSSVSSGPARGGEGAADVVVEVEVGVLDPDRVVELERHSTTRRRKAAAARSRPATKSFSRSKEYSPAIVSGSITAAMATCGVHGGRLEGQERRIEARQPLHDTSSVARDVLPERTDIRAAPHGGRSHRRRPHRRSPEVPVPHPDLDAEQSHIDDAYRCLAAMLTAATPGHDLEGMAAEAVDLGHAQAHSPPRLARHRHGRAQLRPPGRGAGRHRYVGCRHVEDARGDPVVVDWRADVAVPSTGHAGRRPGPVVTPPPVHDDRQAARRPLRRGAFDDPDSVDAARHGGIPDPLLVELSGATGEMRDIVATIAAEQDEVIRAPPATCLVVQGGPGTGKTVGLHRRLPCSTSTGAARRGGAGDRAQPDLPALHRPGVAVAGGDRGPPDDPRAAAGRHRLPRPCRRRRGGGRQGRRPDGGGGRPGGGRPGARRGTTWRWRRRGAASRFRLAALAAAVHEVLPMMCPTPSGARPSAARRPAPCGPSWSAPRRTGQGPRGAGRDLRGKLEVEPALDRAWPALTAAGVVRRLLTNRAVLAAAAADPGHRRAGGDRAAAYLPGVRRAWTVADLALLIEAEAAVAGPPRAYGHIVVDEAQDPSAMGLRALARRSPAASMTVLKHRPGHRVGAQESWDEAIAHLGGPAVATWADLDPRLPGPGLDHGHGQRPAGRGRAWSDPCAGRYGGGGRSPVFVAARRGLGDEVRAGRRDPGRRVRDGGRRGARRPAGRGGGPAGDGAGAAPARGQGPGVRRRRGRRAGRHRCRDQPGPAPALRRPHPAVQELVVVHARPLPEAMAAAR